MAIRLIPAGPDKDITHPNAQFHCYVDVDDVDAVYASMKARLARLHRDHVRPPFDTGWGTREFHVAGPEAFMISFGAPL